MVEDGTFVAALPRSLLHLRFLVENRPSTQLVLFRDAGLAPAIEQHFPGRSLYLGREQRPSRNPLHLLRIRAENRAYYHSVAQAFASQPINRLILFLEGEPLERFIISRFAGEIELWEDGISHYIDLTSPLWYAARGLIQGVSGFYAGQITQRRADRSRMTVRDRFERRDLVLAPPKLGSRRAGGLLIGSPLVEDGIASPAVFRRAVQTVAAGIAPLELKYLPHPRENLGRLDEALAGIPRTSLIRSSAGLLPHLAEHSYLLYAAANSTALLDLCEFDRSLFVPSLFGLGRMDRELRAWEANPVMVGGMEALAKLAARLQATGQPDPASIEHPEGSEEPKKPTQLA